jgi:hypothetical protein
LRNRLVVGSLLAALAVIAIFASAAYVRDLMVERQARDILVGVQNGTIDAHQLAVLTGFPPREQELRPVVPLLKHQLEINRDWHVAGAVRPDSFFTWVEVHLTQEVDSDEGRVLALVFQDGHVTPVRGSLLDTATLGTLPR